MSFARRLQVGSVIVKNNTILSYGWNGMPTGWANDCEDVEWCSAGGYLSPEEIEEGWPFQGEYQDEQGNTVRGRYRLITKPQTLHSEMNSLMKVAQSTESSKGATMFCTHAPCMDCAKAIFQAGISTLYYREEYRSKKGIEFLQISGVTVHRFVHSI